MKIVVIGSGYVGLVSACCLANSGHEVWTVEKDPKRFSTLKEGHMPIHEAGLDKLFEKCFNNTLFVENSLRTVPNAVSVAIIAVGTPSRTDGTVDLSQIETVIEELTAWCDYNLTIVMKSTVPPGTGQELMKKYFARLDKDFTYVSNPEFLREGSAIADWYLPDRIVLGSTNEAGIQIMEELYADIKAPIVTMDVTSAEMTKYAANAFLATKISFINEIACLCEKVSADVDCVAKGIGFDKRIGPHFLKPGIGYGGSCFPKDTRGLEALSKRHDHSFHLLSAVIEVNKNQVNLAVEKITKSLDGLEGKRICVLGLAFKPGTDDIRESPGIEIVAKLVSAKALVTVVDPIAMESFKAKYSQWKLTYCHEESLELGTNSQAIVIATDWPQFIQLDWCAIYNRMLQPRVILDGRNCLDAEKMKRIGFVYLAFGRRNDL